MKKSIISSIINAEKKANKGLMIFRQALYMQQPTPNVEAEAEHLDMQQECNLAEINCIPANALRAYQLFRNDYLIHHFIYMILSKRL